jgi:acyl-CoA synthetase (AMP-forming)/AMP-acid ligase II
VEEVRVDIIGMHAQNKPDSLALIEDERSLSWAAYFKERNRLANALLGLGVEPGSTLVQFLHNSIESCLVSAAASELKTTNTPINHRLKAEEVAYILDDSDAVCVVSESEFLPVLEEARQLAPRVRHWVIVGDEVPSWAKSFAELVSDASPEPVKLPQGAPAEGQAMIYTSGTTGKPKGARRRGISNPAAVMTWIQEFGLRPDDVHLVAGPLYHSAPLAFATIAQAIGNTSVIMRKYRPERALELIDRHKVTTTFMAPTLVKRMLQVDPETFNKYDLSSLRVLIVAGAPCPQKVKEDVWERIGPVLYEFYGSTELGINTILKPEETIRKPGSCGRAMPGVEIALFDENGEEVGVGRPGELHVRRNPMVFDEYYKKPEATEKARKGEWVSVGDVAYRDEDGFYYICDRKIDMIISGGVNIYPAEIEDVLHRHPKIADVAVFGIPDEEWGERVHAAVQPVDGESVTAEELEAWAREHLADYKVPRSYSFHSDFPRDMAGKLIKRQLRDPYWAGRESKV